MDKKETREVRIVNGDYGYYVEVFNLELDDELSYYKDGMTYREAQAYVRELKEKYNIIMVEW